ncbi:MAG: hypothetical protein WBX00_21045 [Isosphaeraceae bacterium]
MDKNPLAAEMAKLSLWLLTLAKYKPFTFLDHAIRCGDSLVGIRDIRQVQYFQLDLDHADRSLFAGPVMGLVDEAVALRKKIEALPANTVEDVREKERLLAEAEKKTARLRLAADLLISVEFQPVSSAGEKEALHNSMADYEPDELVEVFRSVMRKGTTYDREEVIPALARHLGFVRLTDGIREPIRKTINRAIRQGLLGYEGSLIWRA